MIRRVSSTYAVRRLATFSSAERSQSTRSSSSPWYPSCSARARHAASCTSREISRLGSSDLLFLRYAIGCGIACTIPWVIVWVERLLPGPLLGRDVLQVQADARPGGGAAAHRVHEHVRRGEVRPDVRMALF